MQIFQELSYYCSRREAVSPLRILIALFVLANIVTDYTVAFGLLAVSEAFISEENRIGATDPVVLKILMVLAFSVTTLGLLVDIWWAAVPEKQRNKKGCYTKMAAHTWLQIMEDGVMAYCAFALLDASISQSNSTSTGIGFALWELAFDVHELAYGNATGAKEAQDRSIRDRVNAGIHESNLSTISLVLTALSVLSNLIKLCRGKSPLEELVERCEWFAEQEERATKAREDLSGLDDPNSCVGLAVAMLGVYVGEKKHSRVGDSSELPQA